MDLYYDINDCEPEYDPHHPNEKAGKCCEFKLRCKICNCCKRFFKKFFCCCC